MYGRRSRGCGLSPAIRNRRFEVRSCFEIVTDVSNMFYASPPPPPPDLATRSRRGEACCREGWRKMVAMATVVVARTWTGITVARLSAAAVMSSSRMNKGGRSATGASRRFRGAMRLCFGPCERALGMVCVFVFVLGLEVIWLGNMDVCACVLSARCRVSCSPPAVHALPPLLFIPALPHLVLLRISATAVQFAPSILLSI